MNLHISNQVDLNFLILLHLNTHMPKAHSTYEVLESKFPFSDYELNERCKRHIAIKTTDVQKTVLVLEENLHTDNFKLMPDGIIRLYDYLNDLETVASALAESHILVTGLSVSGDTLEDYFLSKIGGTKDVKSPKN